MQIKRIIKKLLRTRIRLQMRKRFSKTRFTIFSSNCIAGVLYNELGLEFCSPTINMYMIPCDFIKFCKNPTKYINGTPRLLHNEDVKYPVVEIEDITLHCLHYTSYDEVLEKWKSRSKKIIWNDIYLIMSERDGCTLEDLIEFDNLPYKNKVVFVHKEMKDIKSSVYIPKYELKGNDYHKVIALTDYISKFSGKRYFDFFDFVEFFNK